MARDFIINGESMVYVKGPVGSAIANLSELGLSENPIIVRPQFNHEDINVDAWGEAPADVQWMLGTVAVTMRLIHYDTTVLDACVALAMGGEAQYGQMGRAGQRMGNNAARFASGNSYIGLNISSPVANLPYRFYFAYLAVNPIEDMMSTKKKVITCNWRVVPYTQDPYNSGSGAANYVLWDRTLDT